MKVKTWMKKKKINGTWQFVSIMGHCSQWLLEQSLFLCSCPDGHLETAGPWAGFFLSCQRVQVQWELHWNVYLALFYHKFWLFFLFLEIYNMYLRGVGIPCVNVCCYVACNVCASIIPLTHESIEGSLCPLWASFLSLRDNHGQVSLKSPCCLYFNVRERKYKT